MPELSTRTYLLGLAAVGLLLAAIGTLAERRRNQRRNLDEVGWVPWTVITVIGATVAVASLGFALKVND